MRRVLLSVGVSAGGFASRKKIAKRFSEPDGFSPQERRTLKRPREVSRRRFLVCPPGLEPGPKASEGVKSYTICIFLCLSFDFLHIFMLLLV